MMDSTLASLTLAQLVRRAQGLSADLTVALENLGWAPEGHRGAFAGPVDDIVYRLALVTLAITAKTNGADFVPSFVGVAEDFTARTA